MKGIVKGVGTAGMPNRAPARTVPHERLPGHPLAGGARAKV